jgi:hypothetical protein
VLHLILKDIARPISQRLGTALGAVLAGLNVSAADQATVAAAVPIVVGLMFDLVIRRLF